MTFTVTFYSTGVLTQGLNTFRKTGSTRIGTKGRNEKVQTFCVCFSPVNFTLPNPIIP